jgi:elongation factor 1-beta
MGFGDVNTASGLQALELHLADKSYIEGYVPTQADVVVFKALSGPPNSTVNALRWYRHIDSFGKDAAAFPAAGVDASNLVSGAPAAAAPAAARPAGRPAKKVVEEEEEDDDDFDMFGSDDEVDEEAEAEKQRRLAAYAEKKAKKPALIAKSNIILDVKPWDDETDLNAMETEIRKIETEGLLWGTATKKPVAFGVFKLVICAVVEDDKVSVDWLEEQITSLEDYVQSVDVAAFQKI